LTLSDREEISLWGSITGCEPVTCAVGTAEAFGVIIRRVAEAPLLDLRSADRLACAARPLCGVIHRLPTPLKIHRLITPDTAPRWHRRLAAKKLDRPEPHRQATAAPRLDGDRRVQASATDPSVSRLNHYTHSGTITPWR